MQTSINPKIQKFEKVARVGQVVSAGLTFAVLLAGLFGKNSNA